MTHAVNKIPEKSPKYQNLEYYRLGFLACPWAIMENESSIHAPSTGLSSIQYFCIYVYSKFWTLKHSQHLYIYMVYYSHNFNSSNQK